ncbi:transmembrane pair domain-containing protein [Pseudodesulfovibrio mercurii]|uniref:Transmembrane pair domain-containing protein n=1 Tax=Pseudodesulfovibrio mercurii TaxID=641491 RepID=F0JBN7_9BACT|nr:PACE efflux transporter [Pseudodesulfovibrio mercurii]EGB15540.1 transmembrane pair domain-containing protein [Pseudodesulfovibrio mercurii]
MRTHADRLRHTLLYEFFGLLTCTPLAAWALDRELLRVGMLSVSMSAAAMICNYLFNLAFDHLLLRLGRPLNVRPPWLRAVHALSFEISLTLVTVPLISWWLDLSLWSALVADLGFTVFFLAYTYLYNWAYDALFPMPAGPATQPAGD